MSFVSRLWNAIRSARYVGRDLEGNKYFETRSLVDSSRMRRTVEYCDSGDMWRYIGGHRRLAIQWSAWLSHTRKTPPTIQELEADVARQQRLSENVARIEARDREEVEQLQLLRNRERQLALEDAAARNERSALMHHEDSVLDSSVSSTALTESTSSPTTNPSSNSDSTANNVLPPTFLSPASPRNAKTSDHFSKPRDNEDKNNSASQEQLSQQTGAQSSPVQPQESHRKQSTSIPPWPSQPPPDTQSWQPKSTRRRG